MPGSREARYLKRMQPVVEDLYQEASQRRDNAFSVPDGTQVSITEQSTRITGSDGRIALYVKSDDGKWKPESVLIPAGRRGVMGAYTSVEKDQLAEEGMRVAFQAQRSRRIL